MENKIQNKQAKEKERERENKKQTEPENKQVVPRGWWVGYGT